MFTVIDQIAENGKSKVQGDTRIGWLSSVNDRPIALLKVHPLMN